MVLKLPKEKEGGEVNKLGSFRPSSSGLIEN